MKTRNSFYPYIIYIAVSIVACFVSVAEAQAQDQHSDKLINLNVNQQPFVEILSSIADQTGYKFSYNPQVIDSGKSVSVYLNGKTLDETLQIILPAGVTYKIINQYVIILPKQEAGELSLDDERMLMLNQIPPSQNQNIIIGRSPIDASEKRNETMSELVKNKSVTTPSQFENKNDIPYINIQVFNVDNFHTVEIDYTIDHITLYESESDDLILKEHLRRNDEEYFAWMRQSNGSLQIKSGKRFPWFKNASDIEVYVPKKYKGILKITNINGRIESEMDMELKGLYISTVSGLVSLKSVFTDEIELKSASGKITTNDLEGSITVSSVAGIIKLGNVYGDVKEISNVSALIDVSYIESENIVLKSTVGKINVNHAAGRLYVNTFSGAVNLNDVKGSADISATTSPVTIRFSEMDDDLFVKTYSGRISVVVPRSSSFQLSASSSSGKITTNIDNQLTDNVKMLNQQVGETPKLNVNLITTAGNIELKYP
ncbi:hypothetical protein D0T49_09255 [Paludibacter sp. 221]|uniref:DUF4097 family beta strand repeat-containing protein n=1 Tax=Paludibacter sp. 221 TaxID=2302939 RepID=UPI0013D8453E|nr:DUF4097 family beta strand repeat-containing protein [Paludibacter sp. 221]NDV47230.1 hypothetical protein [Paludibacter sp. 221]